MPIQTIKRFLKLESAGGILLMISAALAMIVANSPYGKVYDEVQHLQFTVAISEPIHGDHEAESAPESETGPLNAHSEVEGFEVSLSVLHWINDGLMAIFFLLVALELKREIMFGELSSPKLIALPGFAAFGGMLVPALIFAAFNWSNSVMMRGWAVPSATDIAFALGALSLVRGVPLSLKVFLTALAVLDDLGAIVIIAFFYTEDLSVVSLLLSILGLLGLVILNRMKVMSLAAYLLIGVFIWVCVLKSGVHATLAGVAVGLAIPAKGNYHDGRSLAAHLQHILHPWVAYGILPVFAFFNAGVSLKGVNMELILSPVVLGIGLGLFVGKLVGVTVFSWLAMQFKLARMPSGANWKTFIGVAILCGIGFTMSLFIGTLAWQSQPTYRTEFAPELRIGVLGGSIISALVGFIMLKLVSNPKESS